MSKKIKDANRYNKQNAQTIKEISSAIASGRLDTAAKILDDVIFDTFRLAYCVGAVDLYNGAIKVTDTGEELVLSDAKGDKPFRILPKRVLNDSAVDIV
jgi:hypothetical protein